ncbi:unnamed protein product, partial [marine sediment metagenome]
RIKNLRIRTRINRAQCGDPLHNNHTYPRKELLKNKT